MLLKEITKLTDTHPPVIPLTVYFKYFQDHILDCEHVEGLIRLGTAFSIGSLMRADEACFDQLFIIGPGGVVILLAVLNYSYCLQLISPSLAPKLLFTISLVCCLQR
jgi:hypothetical protein